jgi:uncharacterized protein
VVDDSGERWSEAGRIGFQPIAQRRPVMRTIARTHPMAVFLAIAYLIGAAVFALPLLANTGIGLIDLDLPGTAPFVLLSALSLVASAFITTALAEGRPGVRELRSRVFRFRVKPGWYAVALVGLPLVAVATAAVVMTANPIGAIVGSPGVLATAVIGAVVAFLLVNWWEEAGWTGFAFERLQPRLGPIGASVATTFLQALLHLPLVFVAGGVTVGRVPMEQVPLYLVALFILPISVRILIAWIYNSTGRSVPIVGLFHAGLGVATNPDFTTALFPGFPAGLVYGGFAVVAVAALVITRGRLGYHPGSALTDSVAAPASAGVA